MRKSRAILTHRSLGFAAAVLAIALIAALSCFSAAPSECIEAAEEAGLPDEVIDQLRNPGDLNAIERAALNRILSEAEIDDLCEVASDSASMTSGTTPDSNSPDPTQPANKEPPETAVDQENRQDQQRQGAYAECLDEVFLRAVYGSNDVSEFWLPATIWYCRELMPAAPQASASVARCNLDQIEGTQQRYPEWADILHHWHAIAVCNPFPTPDTTHIGTNSNIQPTVFSACLDNAYLNNAKSTGHGQVTIGISTWLCQDYLPAPPESHSQRCYLRHEAETQELYSEWPEDLHNWHAIMQAVLAEMAFETRAGRESFRHLLERHLLASGRPVSKGPRHTCCCVAVSRLYA